MGAATAIRALLLMSLCIAGLDTAASALQKIVVFGDSLSDNGEAGCHAAIVHATEACTHSSTAAVTVCT